MEPILSRELFGSWVEALGLPDNCRRMVIDLDYENVVKVYYECLGDERLLNIAPPSEALKISVNDIVGDVDEVKA